MKLVFQIIIKDLSIWILYFILLKFNITGETYTDEMLSNFPEATNITFLEMILASMYISGFVIVIDILVLVSIWSVVKEKITDRIKNHFFLGLILHFPVVIFWSSLGSGNAAFWIAISISLLIAGTLWSLLNLNKPVSLTELKK